METSNSNPPAAQLCTEEAICSFGGVMPGIGASPQEKGVLWADCFGEANPTFTPLFQHGHIRGILSFSDSWRPICREPESASRASAFWPRGRQISISDGPFPTFRSC